MFPSEGQNFRIPFPGGASRTPTRNQEMGGTYSLRLHPLGCSLGYKRHGREPVGILRLCSRLSVKAAPPSPVSDLPTAKGKSTLHRASWLRTARAGMAGYNVPRGTRWRTKHSGRTAPLPALFPRRRQQYELESEGRPRDGRWPARRKIPIQPRAAFDICHHRDRHGTATSGEVGYRSEFRCGV